MTYTLTGACTVTKTSTITVNNNTPPPCAGVSTVSYSLSNSTTASQKAIFDKVISQNNPIDYLRYDFGDGVISTFTPDLTVSHDYQAGNYTVSETVILMNGHTCTSTDVITIDESCQGVSSVGYTIESGTSSGYKIKMNLVTSTLESIDKIQFKFETSGSFSTYNETDLVYHNYNLGSYTITQKVVLESGKECLTSSTLNFVDPCLNVSTVSHITKPNSNGGSLVSFTKPSYPTTKSISTILYDFGDGNSQNFLPGSEVEYFYLKQKSYTITQTIFFTNNTQCSSSETIELIDYCSNVSPVSASFLSNSDNGLKYKVDAPTLSAISGVTISSLEFNFGDGNISEYLTSKTVEHTYDQKGNYTIIQTVLLSNGYKCKSSQVVSIDITCSSYSPIAGKRYWVSAWVKEEHVNQVLNYDEAVIKLGFGGSSTTFVCKPSGDIIDGWQRIVQEFRIPENATSISIDLISNNFNAYFDDIRIHPFNASMKSYVYDPNTLLLNAELDDNNYATFYEYDKEGQLIRIKKETERGIMTIQESRSSNPKKE